MIRKIVTHYKLGDPSAREADLAYWLGKDPADRIAAVDALRRQFYGNPGRLQRTARVVQRAQR